MLTTRAPLQQIQDDNLDAELIERPLYRFSADARRE